MYNNAGHLCSTSWTALGTYVYTIFIIHIIYSNSKQNIQTCFVISIYNETIYDVDLHSNMKTVRIDQQCAHEICMPAHVTSRATSDRVVLHA